jgi:sigma-E factor negative regulatory protein RseA
MMRDPGLDKLLAAHRQFGGATALGTSSGFLRNATFEGPAR